MSSKAECLKRYMSDPAGGKKKKKKKVTCTGPVHLTKTKIVDDDVDWREIAPELKSDDEEEFVADEEGQPQVVEVVDEQQIAAEKMKWKQIQEQRETMEERRDSDALSDDELPVKRRERHDSDESPPRRCGRKDSDESPPRRERLGSDSSPPRRRKAGKTQTSASERSRQDSDESPPRRRAKDESDESPPRRRNREDSDESPPRRRVRRDSDSSPPRRRRNSREVRGRRDEDDESPPRKRVKAEFDESPPRRERGTAIRSVSHEQRQHGQADTGRRKDRNDSSDFRSNIKEKNDSHEALLRRERKANYLDSRQSTSIGKVTGDSRVRRRHDSDDSPPRRLRRDEPDEEPLRRVRVKVEKSESGGEARHNATGSKIAGITEGRIGTKSGLQTAAVLREENRLTREKEKEVFEKMDGEMSGRGAETVFRDKQGRRIDPKLEKIKQRQAEEEQAREQEKYKKWGSGVAQQRMKDLEIEDMIHEMKKPLARYKDDEDLDKLLREKERSGDPMLEFVRKRKERREGIDKKPERPLFKGSFPPNRFNIRPGYRWDSVDRSNGYEKERFLRISGREAWKETAYKWSVEEM